MPRRKNVDGDAASGQPAKQPRVRKKKESSICSTPTGEHPTIGGGLKLDPSPHQQAMGGPGMPPGCGPGGGPMDGGGNGPLMPPPHGMIPICPGSGMHHMQHPGIPNGVMPGGPQQLGDEGPNGSVGICGPGFGAPQGSPFDFYQQGPPQGGGPPPVGPHPSHFPPPHMPIYCDGPPPPGHPPPQIIMQQQPQSVQGPPSSMGPPQPGTSGAVGPPGQHFINPQPGQEQQSMPHMQMLPPMHHPHHPGAPPPQSGPGPLPTHQGPPPLHQLHSTPHPIFPGAFPRQPGPLILFPPPSIPQPPFLEFRLQEMNRRLYQFHCQFYQQTPCENHEQWWEAFSQEFFDDQSSMSLCMQEFSAEHGGYVTKRYTISRLFIPRFFRSLFTNGTSQLHFVMRSPAQEMFEPHRMQNPEGFGCCALNCENLLMVTSHERPLQAEVQTECRLYVKFAPFNPTYGYRIREWFMELRSCQEFYAKEGMNPMDSLNDRKLMPVTCLGLPLQTMGDIRMWQMMDQMQPIVERVKETNETPQMALHHIVAERLEVDRQQRISAAGLTPGAHTQTPPHSSAGFVPSSVQHPPHAFVNNGQGGVGGMGPPQMPPPPLGVMQPPPQSMNVNAGAGPSTSSDEPKPKPKRQRQRKSAAANAAAAAASSCATSASSSASLAVNSSPPKGKKGGGVGVAGGLLGNSSAGGGGQQTPPAGIPPLGSGPPTGFSLGMPHPGQFHQIGGVPPSGQCHHDVLTVGEPSMMGCEYGEQDERQISRVENTAFASMNAPLNSGVLMLPPPGMNSSGGPPISLSSGQPISGHSQQMIVENSAQSMLGDFDLHSHQQQLPSTTEIWAPPHQSVGIDSAATTTGGGDQWELECAKV